MSKLKSFHLNFPLKCTVTTKCVSDFETFANKRNQTCMLVGIYESWLCTYLFRCGNDFQGFYLFVYSGVKGPECNKSQ